MTTKKRSIAFLLALCLTILSVVNAFADRQVFQDLKNYQYQIELVTDLGFIFYDEKPYYAPDMIVTRDIAAETIYILVNGHLNKADDLDYDTSIPDVRFSNFPIYFCRDMGIDTGFEDGTFKPNNPVTYEDFLKMLITALDLAPVEDLSEPIDYVALAAEKGITKGLSFKTSDLLTNASAALLVYNCLNIPAFGDKGDQTLLDTTFQELLNVTQTANRYINDVDILLNRTLETDALPDLALLYDRFEELSSLYEFIYENNINAAYKYDLKLERYGEIYGALDYLLDLEEEVAALEAGEIRGDRWDVAYTKEEILDYEMTNLEAYLNELEYPEYIPLTKSLMNHYIDLLRKKLELMETSLPTEEDLEKGVAELEQWMIECLYMPKAEKSKTGVVFESTYDFLNLVESTYKELYSLYLDLYEDGVLADEIYEERMDELYYIITAITYMELRVEYSEEAETSQAELAQIAETLAEALREVEFIHYPEQAKHLIDKLTRDYLIPE